MVVVLAPVATAAPKPQPAVTVRTHLRLDSSGAGQAFVSLARPLHHSWGGADLPLTISGPGHFDGLVFLPHGRPLSAEAVSLVVGSVGADGRLRPTVLLGTSADPLPDTLPAGGYDVFVAAVGHVVVNLTLPGEPAGNSSIRVSPAAGVQAIRTTAAAAGGVAVPAAALGETVRPAHGAFLVDLDWSDITAQANHVSGGCVYPGGGTAVDYSTPGCLGGYGGEVDGLVDLRFATTTLDVGWIHLPAGTCGYKAYLAEAAASTGTGIEMLSIVR